MKRLLLFISISCSFNHVGLSQDEADLQKPRIVSPSADAAALGKYGQIPVDKSTGIPSISIPLYDIKTPRFSLPISLSYHAAGIKVEEISSWVGAGWVLNAGGMITRSIIGYADDGGSGFLTYNSRIKKSADIRWPDDILYISDIVNKRIDTDPDNFFFNFNQHSGSFVFGDDTKPAITPYQPIKITYNFTTSSGYIPDFSIVDEFGDFYYFKTREIVTSSIGSQMSGTSSWYLTQMVSADLSDTIDFNYTTDATAQTEISHNFSQDLTDLCNNDITQLKGLVENYSYRTFYPVRLNSITFKGGKVTFSTSNGRLDDGNTSLDGLKIFTFDYTTNQYTLAKSITLNKDYLYSTITNPSNLTPTERNRRRLILTGVQQLDKNNAVVGNYQFNYNSTMLPPVLSNAQDKWGYYNGQNTNQSLLEAKQITYQPTSYANPVYVTLGEGKGADRGTVESFMKAGVLEKITYPTGGYTNFDYQSNKISTTVYTPNSFTVAAIGANNTGGSLETNIQTYTPTGDMLHNGGGTFTIRIAKGNLPNGYSNLPYVKITNLSNGNIVYYKQVTQTADINEVVSFDLTAGTQYEVKAFADGNDNAPSSSSPNAIASVQYQTTSIAVTNVGGLRVGSIKNYNTGGTLINTQTYTYGNNDESGAGTQMSILNSDSYTRATLCTDRPNPNSSEGPGGGSSISTTTTYSNTSYYPLSTLSGSPVGYPMVTMYEGDTTTNVGKTVAKYDIIKDSIYVVPFVSTIKPIPVSWKNGGPVWVGNYRNNGSGQYSLVSEDSMEYDLVGRTGGIGKVISFIMEPIGPVNACDFFTGPTIDNQLGYPRVFSGGSKCQWFPYWFKWYDYPISTGTRVLKKKVSKVYNTDGSLSTSSTANYYYDNMAHMLPTRIEDSTSKAELRLKQIRYPQDMVKDGNDPTGIYTSMVAANMLNFPIETKESINSRPLIKLTTNYGLFNGNLIKQKSVEVQNANNIPETRFQYLTYDNRGNPTCFVKDNGPKTTYLWGYQKQFPVASVVNADYSTVIGLINANILENVNGPYTEPQVRDELNKIRTGLASSKVLVSTYTYKALAGITSETDPAGKTTYYEYDAFNRLKNIKDWQGNIVKNFQYNYQNSCGANCFVLPMQTFSGSNTISYPVGVFNVNGQLLGNAISQSQYISTWNSNTANQAKGSIAAGFDSLHFNFTIASGQTPPTAVTGLRYYQFDLDYTSIDGVRKTNGEFVDFGDGNVLRLGSGFNPSVLPANTTVNYFPTAPTSPYIIHNYPNSNNKTLTLYHNDASEESFFDNYGNPATSLTKLKNLRGNLPQFMLRLGGSCYQQATMNSVANVINWNTMNSVRVFKPSMGDGTNPCMNMNYAQDFMTNDKGLQQIFTTYSGYYLAGYRDTTFKISRLKSGWNTYFTELNYLAINEDHWNHEDLSSLKKLSTFVLIATNDTHSNTSGNIIPISVTVIDNVINQIAAGAGNAGVKNGIIGIYSGGTALSSASNAAKSQLISAGWKILIDGVTQ